MKKEDQLAKLLTRGVAEVIGKEDLEKKLHTGKKLRIKLGIDPTSPNLHIGRGVVLLKLRDFQALGHHIVFIIGDFTGEIGDTSDKESERPMLSTAQVKKNMKTYFQQAGKLLDMAKVEIHHNSEWLDKVGYRELCRQASAFSVAEMINRELIKKRLSEGGHIGLHELLYPLMQGYDSVNIKADVELGGTDQRFNMLAGRTLQKLYNQVPQNVMTTNLILGTDGRKMSSSWGNTINFTDAPDDMFGKVMSIPDTLIASYFVHCTRAPMDEIAKIESAMKKNTINPRDAKMHLAREIVTLYHNTKAAEKAEKNFIALFQKKEVPDDIVEIHLNKGEWNITDLLVETKLASSKNEARRLIEQGGVTADGTEVRDIKTILSISSAGTIIKKGKRHFVRVMAR